MQANAQEGGRHGESYRTSLKRIELIARVTDVKEIGDCYAMAAMSAFHLGRYREAEGRASTCIERARGIDSGSYLHGLTWRIQARFVQGDWEGAFADQAELERVVALAPRELPPAYTMGGYMRAALCHELRGEHDESDRYIALGLRYFEQRIHRQHGPTSVHLAPLALVLARRGRFDEALALIPLVARSTSAGGRLEALCEITAARERWGESAGLVAAVREEAEVGEQLSLPLYADRLEGRAAAARGDAPAAAEMLRRSAEGFAAIEARWEEAWSRLLLAEVVLRFDPQVAERQLRAALPVLVRLGSVREAERARASLEEIAVAG